MIILINIYQKILIAAAGVILLLFAATLIYLAIRKKKIKHKIAAFYYPIVNRTAQYRDLYLINNLKLKTDEIQVVDFHHVLFGNKYIYVIYDYWAKGSLSGAFNSNFWALSDAKTKASENVDNLFAHNNYKIKKLSLSTGINYEFFISIVLVNNELRIGSIDNYNDNYIIAKKDFYRLISALEGRDVPSFKKEQLQQIVLDIDKKNARKEVVRSA